MEDLIPLENVMRDQQQVSRLTPCIPCTDQCIEEGVDVLTIPLVMVVLSQSEQVRFGHNYSDDESEFAYNQPSRLMTTELAQRTTKTVPAQKLLRPITKVCTP